MSNYEKVKEWRKKNPDKVAAQNKRYTEKHPETHKKAAKKYRENNLELIRVRDKEAQRRTRRNNPEAQRIRYENWRARHEARLWDKAGRPRSENCEICGVREVTVFDHCHVTDKFRGWICDRCNKTLGLVKDSPHWLRKMAEYLENFNGKVDSKKAECSAQVEICSSSREILPYKQ